MAKGKIDPAFIAAPFFGESSYDPIAEVRRIKAEGAAYGQAAQARAEKDQQTMMKTLDFDMKGWADEEGFDEISKDLEDVRSQYVDLSTQGLNMTDPNNLTEQKIAKAFRTRIAQIKQKHDVWQQQKKMWEDVDAVIAKEKQLPEDEQDIDLIATAEKKAEWMKGGKSVLDRSMGVENILVGKSRPVDVGKYMLASLPKLIPGLDKSINQSVVDEATGKWKKTTWEGVSSGRALLGMKKAINGAPTNVKNAIKTMYEADPEKGVRSIDEWALDQWGPAYPTKTSTEVGVSGSGGSGGSGGGGLPAKDPSGSYPLQPQVRDMHYSSASGSQDQVYPYESVGRVPIGDLFGYRNITVMGSANNMNTRTGTTEGKGEAVPAVPVEMNMFPVASKDIELTVNDPKTGEEVAEKVKKGERIPQHILEKIRLENANAREKGEAPVYLTEYRPYVTLGLSYKQRKEGAKAGGDLAEYNIYVSDNARPTSYTETSIVPYDEIKQDLFAGAKENKQNWDPYDQYIREMTNQLNSTAKVNNIFEDKTKSVDDIYRALEGKE